MKDTFVNLNLLYEEIDAILEKLDTKMAAAGIWLDERHMENDWLPEEVKTHIGYAYADNKKAREMVEDIKEIFLDFKRKSRNKPALALKQKSRIRHLNVHKGGLYSPPEVVKVVEDDLISDSFKEWREAQKVTDHHENA